MLAKPWHIFKPMHGWGNLAKYAVRTFGKFPVTYSQHIPLPKRVAVIIEKPKKKRQVQSPASLLATSCVRRLRALSDKLRF